jgi:membrane protein YqaA with SNARE-associated domain
LIIVGIFKDEINAFGADIMRRYGRTQVDIILYLITAVSASPLVLPIWQYVMIGVAMGYGIVHLAVVMAFGSATGSVITYYIGRYFGHSRFVRNKFPKAQNHPWVAGRSKWFVTAALFLGTASPIPFDILYFACGIKRYPVMLLFVACVLGRIIRYLYLGYGFDFFSQWL